jgi:hypothetical protein
MAVLDFSPLTSQPSFGERYAQGQQQSLQNQLAKQQSQMQTENMLGLREERSALADQRRAATEGTAQRQAFLNGLGKKMSEGGHKLDRSTLSSMLQYGLMNKEGSVVELATKGLQALDEEDVFKTESTRLGMGATTEKYTPVQIQNMLLSSSASMRDRGKALAAMKEPTLYSMAPGSTLAGAGGQVYTAPAAPVKSIGSVSPGDFTPASLAKFNVSGNFGDLVPKPVDRAPRPEAAVRTQQVTMNDGTLGIMNMDTGAVTPATLGGAAVKGKPSALAEKQAAAKVQLQKDLTFAITELGDAIKEGGLIDQSTGSGAGRLADIGAGFVGKATPGAIAIGKLQPIADLPLKLVTRFEGPQSNADTKSYKEASAQLADPTLPRAIRKAAGATVVRLMKERQGQFVTNDMAPTVENAAKGGWGQSQVVNP